MSTATLYNLHRLIGLRLIKIKNGRFEIISQLDTPLKWITLIGIITGLYLFINFDISRKILLLLPCLLSVAYIVPIFPGGKRFRDLSFAKGALLAFSWAILTVTIPYFEKGIGMPLLPFYTFERFLFIFAMGLSFDIRDLSIDRSNKVKTIPNVLGRQASIIISTFCLILAIIISFLIYEFAVASVLAITYIVGGLLVLKSTEQRSDFYYGFWVDMIVGLPLIIYLLYASLLI